MLGQRRRRCASIETILGERLMFAVYCPPLSQTLAKRW